MSTKVVLVHAAAGNVKHLMKMTHEEYVASQRIKVGVITQGMLEGSVPYLEGAIELAALRHEIEAPEYDQDFVAFIAVASEIDHLPIGEHRKNWSEEALARHEHEIIEAEKWAKEFSLSECKSLKERFGA